MPRVYTKKLQNAAPLFLTWRYFFGKAMLDKKGNNWQLSASISPGSTVF